MVEESVGFSVALPPKTGFIEYITSGEKIQYFLIDFDFDAEGEPPITNELHDNRDGATMCECATYRSAG